MWPFRRQPPPLPPADPRVAAATRYRDLAEPTTSDAAALLQAWGFTPGPVVAFAITRRAQRWHHDLLPEVDYLIHLEADMVLDYYFSERILRAVMKLAERQGVLL